ncbi:hypothetical protein I546_0534 [Mycobacterium kansasii 732]|nr:hypothetical protein I546_0534 [Mycobacterium kansasii 732]
MTATPVVLCGTNYGACYVPSLQELTDSFELVGILAAGSERSARLAARRNVPGQASRRFPTRRWPPSSRFRRQPRGW